MSTLNLSETDKSNLLTFIQAARENLDRIEAVLNPSKPDQEEELDPRNPLNKTDQFLTPRGIEVCYRLFDMGKSRYAVAEALQISYGAATHRFHQWEKLGGKDRKRQPLD